jgi:hypothetical protein
MEMGRREFNITLTDDEDPGYTEMSFDDFHDFMVADLAATIKDISEGPFSAGVPGRQGAVGGDCGYVPEGAAGRAAPTANRCPCSAVEC